MSFSSHPTPALPLQKWMNALQEHIDFSSHYIRQGSVDLQDSDEQELLKPLGSMQVQQRWHVWSLELSQAVHPASLNFKCHFLKIIGP